MNTHSVSRTGHAHGKADYIGIAGSVLCLLHCLFTPALALGTSLSTTHHTAFAGVINLDYFFILLNGVAVYMATRDHKLPLLRLFLWSSLLVFSVSLVLESQHVIFEIMGYAGSGLLIVGHVYNLLFCRPWETRQVARTSVSK
jgi:hypothetical protein